MNVGNILAVAEAIEKRSVPGLGFNMNIMLDKPDSCHADVEQNVCGTVACIAGWSYVMATGRTRTVEDRWGGSDAERPAAEWLGLDEDTAKTLFFPENTGDKDFDAGHWDGIPRAAAVRCLRNLAITGKVDWLAAIKDADPVLPAVPERHAIDILT